MSARAVAAQIRRLRQARGWTQEEAGRRLAEHGITWSKANWSARERSVDHPDRVAAFTADEVTALAALFGVTPNVLFSVEETYTITLHREDGSWWSEISEVPGCYAAGDSLGEWSACLAEALAVTLPGGAQ